jgi:ankyrin repeat protein
MINLRTAVIENNPDNVKTILEANRKENGFTWNDEVDDHIKNACRDAVRLGHERIVHLLLDEGLSADMKGGYYPLNYYAAAVGNLSMVKLLVGRGATIQQDQYSERDDQDAMRIAIKGGHADVIQYLLENGGNPNGCFEKSFQKQSFLGRAAVRGQRYVVGLFLKHGAEIKTALTQNIEKFLEKSTRYRENISQYTHEIEARHQKHYSEQRVKDLNQIKQEYIDKLDILIRQYSYSFQILLDHAIGTNFDEESIKKYKDLDIAGFNFVGVSVNAQPITRQMLASLGFKNAEKAILTWNGLASIEDKERRDALLERVEAMLQSQGRIISHDGIVNLVPLADAAKAGHLDVVLVRLSHGINPNQKTTDSDSSLAIVAAAENGYFDIVKLLAEHPEIDKKSCVTASHAAQNNNHTKIAEYLNETQNVNEKDLDGDALIHKAVKAKDIHEIRTLLRRGADINLENRKGHTPLMIAVLNSDRALEREDISENDRQLLHYLLENGADPNKYQGNLSPLHAAAGNYTTMSLLIPITEKRDMIKSIGHGEEKKEIRTPWYVPLMFDSYRSKNWLQILSLLKNYGADFNARHPRTNKTLLHNCIKHFTSFTRIDKKMCHLKEHLAGNKHSYGSSYMKTQYEDLMANAKIEFVEKLEQLDFLLANGADPSIHCLRKMRTPLHLFIAKIDLGFIEGAIEQVIDRLLNHHVDINAKDACGNTPLHEAAKFGDLKAAACLINKGAEINVTNKTKHTPLHLAALGNPQTTALLIKSGADVKAVDLNGFTALALSRQESKRKADKKNLHKSKKKPDPYFEAQKELIRAGGI